MSALAGSLQLGKLNLPNRILMAPMTRSRAVLPSHCANDLMAEYYAQRASSGLIIAEATAVHPHTWAFWSEPGIFTVDQVEAWKAVTKAVHDKGGRMFSQLWHAGRAAHPVHNPTAEGRRVIYESGPIETNQERHAALWKKIDPNLEGSLELSQYEKYFHQGCAPSPLAIAHRDTVNALGAPLKHPIPRELTDVDIKRVVQSFAVGANNAMIAGFDGVELHGANGYIISQFYMTSSNKRKASESEYHGESLEGRCRLLFEVVDAIVAAVAAAKGETLAEAALRVGVRFSPISDLNSGWCDDPAELTRYVVEGLKPRKIAYLHFERRDAFTRRPEREEAVLAEAVKYRDGAKDGHNNLILNWDVTVEEGEQLLQDNVCDAVAFGRLWISNPDLDERISIALQSEDKEVAKKIYAPLKEGPKYFYAPNKGVTGYTDYPKMTEEMKKGELVTQETDGGVTDEMIEEFKKAMIGEAANGDASSVSIGG